MTDNHNDRNAAEVVELAQAVMDDRLGRDGAARLDALLREDEDARWTYSQCMNLFAGLAWDRTLRQDEKTLKFETGAEEAAVSGVPLIVTGPLSTARPSSYSLIGGWAASYIAATVILGMMLLGAWAYKISHDYRDFAGNNSRRSTTSGGTARQRPEFVAVGRVTGMSDCRWADPTTEAFPGSSVPLGRKYALSSGLMEITYRSGARVILEGPCRYEVESAAGGFLALGKLTAKVEKNPEFGIRNSEKRMQANSQFPIPNSQLFFVRTPTAVVTDLGTEFGVEVAANGDTMSHVFQGKVVVRAEGLAASAASGSGPKSQITLAAGQSARVEKDAATGAARIVTTGKVGPPPKFVRKMYDAPKLLDLLDIVAGGNGTGNRRERGIDPTTGMEDPILMPHKRDGNGKYHRVKWHDLIDGAFVPDGRAGAVTLDSAGHAFAQFPETCGETWGSVWARDAEVQRDEIYWIYSMKNGGQFMPQGRGLLCLCSNVGLTFDLAAARKRFPGVRPARFKATVGMVDARYWRSWAESQADVWIFVDGQLKLKRLELKPDDGTFTVDLELKPGDRFLTIVMTDGGNGRMYDWLVFGDPAIEMVAAEKETRKAE